MYVSYNMYNATFLSTLSLRRATVPSSTVIVIFFTFLSTLSLRRATIHQERQIEFSALFYPRSPCGERLIKISFPFRPSIFSIHALLAESDRVDTEKVCESNDFLSTLSLRRATVSMLNGPHSQKFFYPRSPCGERLKTPCVKLSIDVFLSTLSLRRATITDGSICLDSKFSIHALLAESDENDEVQTENVTLFLSTLSLRRATAKVHKTVGHFCAYGTNFMGIASSC